MKRASGHAAGVKEKQHKNLLRHKKKFIVISQK